MACIRGITESLRGGVRMKILLTGAAGQLGQALRQQLPVGVELIATSRSGECSGVDGSAACRWCSPTGPTTTAPGSSPRS